MPSPDPVRLAAVEAAARLLVEVLREGAPAGESVEAVVSDGTVEVRIVIGRSVRAVAADANNTLPAIVRLTPLDRRILAAAGAGEVTMQALANRVDHDNDSYFRARVGKLVATSRLASEFGGYRLP